MMASRKRKDRASISNMSENENVKKSKTNPIRSTQPIQQPKQHSNDQINEQTIDSLEESMQGNTENLNNLITLFDYIDQQLEISNSRLVSAAYQALHRTFVHLFESGIIARQNEKLTSLSAVQSWLNDQIERHFSLSLRVLTLDCQPKDGLTSHHAIHSSMLILRSLFVCSSSDSIDYLAKIVKLALSQKLAQSHKSSSSLSWLPIFIQQYVAVYDDLKLNVLRSIDRILKSPVSKSDNALPHQLLLFMLQISPLTLTSSNQGDLFVNSQPVERNIEKLHSDVKSTMDTVFFGLLGLSHSIDDYVLMLKSMDNQIIPSLINPMKLADFLMATYNLNNEVALLALNAMFLLISKYQLNYPFFYQKLYHLLNNSDNKLFCTLSDYPHFFTLLHAFLTSVYLPKKLIAAFVKKLALLSQSAPSHYVAPLIVIIFNLMRRHPGVGSLKGTEQEAARVMTEQAESLTSFLLRRQQQLNQSDIPSFSSSQDAATGTDLIDDSSRVRSYDPTASDPSESGAEHSSLWELKTLCSHYAPSISSLARIFFATNAPKADIPLAPYLNWSFDSMIDSEIDRRKNQKCPISNQKVNGCFSTNDQFSIHIAW